MSKHYHAVLTEDQKREKVFDDIEEIRYHVKLLAFSAATLAGCVVFWLLINLALTATR